MKKNFLLQIVLFLPLGFLFLACEKIDQGSTKELELTTKSSILNTLKDTGLILPPVGERKITNKTLSLEDQSLWAELYQFDQLPIYIEVKENVNGKTFLTGQGLGKEITTEQYNNSINQEFYIRSLPASTGIPYLIYAKNGNAPISVGSYVSNPDKLVLYTKDNDQGSLFGAAWNIKRGEKTQFSFILENIDSWADDYFYNNVLGVDNNGRPYFSKYNKYPYQEFTITPVETFDVIKVDYVNDNTATLQQQPDKIFSTYFINDGPIQQSRTLEINEEITETSNFNNKTSVNATVKAEIKVGIPFIASGKIETSLSSGYESTFGGSSSHKKSIKYTFPILVPAMYRADVKVVFSNYLIDIDYLAKCRGLTSGREIQLRGRWNGVSYYEDGTDLKLTSLENPSITKTIHFKKIPTGQITINTPNNY